MPCCVPSSELGTHNRKVSDSRHRHRQSTTNTRQLSPDNQEPAMITNIAKPAINSQHSTTHTRQSTKNNYHRQIYTTNQTNTCQPNVNNRQDEITARPGWKQKSLLMRSQPAIPIENNCGICHKLEADNDTLTRPLISTNRQPMSLSINPLSNMSNRYILNSC
jgi:hypothetical protein